MRHASHFRTSVEPNPPVLGQLSALISDLRRTISNFEIDIEAEENRARVVDTANVTYPILARNLRNRRGNLLATLSTLETHLNNANERAA